MENENQQQDALSALTPKESTPPAVGGVQSPSSPQGASSSLDALTPQSQTGMTPAPQTQIGQGAPGQEAGRTSGLDALLNSPGGNISSQFGGMFGRLMDTAAATARGKANGATQPQTPDSNAIIKALYGKAFPDANNGKTDGEAQTQQEQQQSQESKPQPKPQEPDVPELPEFRDVRSDFGGKTKAFDYNGMSISLPDGIDTNNSKAVAASVAFAKQVVDWSNDTEEVW